MNIIIDSNIMIGALLKDSKIREIIVNSSDEMYLPEIALSEINEHKQELLNKSGLTEEDFDELFKRLLKYVNLVPNIEIIKFKDEAYEIIGKIDKDDVAFIATSIAFEYCPIWTDDYHFKKQNKIRIITTSEMIENLESNY